MPNNDKLREIFKVNLNRIFNLKGSTQKDLAEFMGVTPATVNEWLKGRKLPRMDKLDMICLYFNVKRSDLMEQKLEATSSEFTKAEVVIIKKYRSLDERGKLAVEAVLDSQYDALKPKSQDEEEIS